MNSAKTILIVFIVVGLCLDSRSQIGSPTLNVWQIFGSVNDQPPTQAVAPSASYSKTLNSSESSSQWSVTEQSSISATATLSSNGDQLLYKFSGSYSENVDIYTNYQWPTFGSPVVNQYITLEFYPQSLLRYSISFSSSGNPGQEFYYDGVGGNDTTSNLTVSGICQPGLAQEVLIYADTGNLIYTSPGQYPRSWEASCTVTLTTNLNTNLATITVNANPPAGGTVTGGGTYVVGSQVQISASPSMFYTFSSWNDGSTADPRTVTVPSTGITYTANFTPTAVITFYQELPNEAAVGHAFLSLTSKNGVTAFYGFYPSTSWIFATPGEIDDDKNTVWNYKIAYSISDAQYRSAAREITHDLVSQLYYSLVGVNCMGWAASIANAAGVQLPQYLNSAGIPDPSTFGTSLKNIGNGNKYDGGLVTEDGPLDPPTPFDYSYSGIENVGHTNAAALATSIGLAYDYVDLGMVNANSILGLSLSLAGSNTNQSLISMNWGDGSSLQEQSLAFSHIYSNGTYQADLLVVDAGAVHSYGMTVAVSSSAPASINVNVTPFSPVSIPNQGLVPANSVPDFVVVQATSMSVLPNGHAVVDFLGVPTWTFTILTSSNLTQAFLPIGSATAGTNGAFQFDDPGAVNANSRFYRASYP